MDRYDNVLPLNFDSIKDRRAILCSGTTRNIINKVLRYFVCRTVEGSQNHQLIFDIVDTEQKWLDIK